MKNKVEDIAHLYQKPSECRKLFRTTFFLLLIFGFDFNSNPSFFRKCLSYILRLLIFSIICTLIGIYVPNFVTTEHTKLENWDFLLSITEICLVALTYILSTIKWRSLFHAVTNCLKNCEEIIGDHTISYKNIRRDIRISYFYLFLVLLLVSLKLLYLGCYYNPIKKSDEVVSSNDTDQFEIFSTSSVQVLVFDKQKYMIEVIVLLSTLLLFCIHLLFVLMYTSSCNIVSQSFLRLTEIEEQKDSFIQVSIGPVYNQRLIKGHQKLCGVVRSLDDVYKQLVAIWHLAELILVVFLLKSCQLVCEPERLVAVIIVSSLYIKKCFAAANVNENILGSLNSAFEGKNRNKLQDKIDLELEMYARSTVLDPPAFTGWGLYVINREFILSYRFCHSLRLIDSIILSICQAHFQSVDKERQRVNKENSLGSVVTYVLVVYNIK